MKNIFSDFTAMKPNSSTSSIECTHFELNDQAYREFCRMLADNEEEREYVCPAHEHSEIERVSSARALRTPISSKMALYSILSVTPRAEGIKNTGSFMHTAEPETYENSASDKPQESYAYMIYRALESSADGKLTLSDIYSWIEENYSFYKTADPVWKNSIRHNLSLNTAFKKIPRPERSKGKGGYWAIDYDSQSNGKTIKRKRIVKNYVPKERASAPVQRSYGKLIF
ncbi:forkhead box protein J1 [Enteropsectra breve]|nr:forkhead box protein J1 [Enteropsectra breve]